MIKQAKDLRVGDVIYLYTHKATGTVKKITTTKHYLCVDFTEQVHSNVILGMSFNWTPFHDSYSIPVIGKTL